MRKLLLLFFIFITLVSCSGFSEAGKVLRNEKTKTTDEFLVKKKEPLVLPPDYDKMPIPGTTSKKKISEEEKIKNILKVSTPKNKNKNKNSSTEDSILNEIRK